MKVNVEKVFSSSILLMIWTMNLNFHGQLGKKNVCKPKIPLENGSETHESNVPSFFNVK
jgi:hypothetical protein